MLVCKKNPAAMLGRGNRVWVIVLYRLSNPSRISPFPQFLFPLADMAGAMLEGVK